MKIIYFVILAAFCTLQNEVFGQARSKTAVERTQELMELTKKKPVVNLNMNRFKEYVKSSPREYSFIVMFTAMATARRCAICQHVYEEFMIVANSLVYSQNQNLFLGIVDFDEGSDIFQLLRLNTAPIIMHFPAKGKRKPTDTMDLERHGVHAEAIAKWITDRTEVQIRIFRPPNYSGVFAIAMLVILVGGLLYMRRNNLEFLYNKQMWAMGSLFFCFAMVSGQMWNQIRMPPFFQNTKNGPVYINGGSHGQFIVESYIVMGLNTAVVLGLILLIEAAGGVRDPSSPNKQIQNVGDNKKKKVQAIVGLALICVFFSLLLSIFRAKTHGYPYSFLFK